jgi:group I intron endonuclease
MVIYKITNTINGKVYIGQTIQSNAKMRWYSHQADARTGKKSHLYDSIRKYGVENFAWEIIEQGSSVDHLNELEAKWLAHYRTITEVYNNRDAGGNKVHSAESIQRMQVAQKAAHARRRELNNGIEKTKKRVQTIKTWSSSKKGKPGKKWSEEAKIQHSIRCKERNYAKHFLKQEN